MIIVSSVSCIYSLGDPIDYKKMVISLRPGTEISRETLIHRLIDIQYERNDMVLERNRFACAGTRSRSGRFTRMRTWCASSFSATRSTASARINPLTGVTLGELGHIAIFPASHYVTPKDKLQAAIRDLEDELDQRVQYFEERGKLIEAQRHCAAHAVRH